jgi:hypothetical protein
MHTNGYIPKVMPLSATWINDSLVTIMSDSIVIGNPPDGYKAAFADNIWYYEYDQQSGESKLERITDAQQFRDIVQSILKNSINEPIKLKRMILRENLRDFIMSCINIPKGPR